MQNNELRIVENVIKKMSLYICIRYMISKVDLALNNLQTNPKQNCKSRLCWLIS